MNNKKEDDIFSDLEKDIEGDWELIQSKIRKEEYKENINKVLKEPKRFNFIDFRNFYKCMVEIAYKKTRFGSEFFEILARKIIHDTSEEKLPKSLISIFNALCNTTEYNVITEKCINCKNIYDVTYKKEKNYLNSLYIYERYNIENKVYTETMKTENIICPKCGIKLITLINGKMISISLTPKDSKNGITGEEGEYDIKRKF